MASEKITAIVESVKTMTVLELKELVDTICEEFGVSAVAAAAPAAAGAAAAATGQRYLQRGPGRSQRRRCKSRRHSRMDRSEGDS